MCGSPESGIEGICTSIDPHEALNAYVIYIYIFTYALCSYIKINIYIYLVFVCVKNRTYPWITHACNAYTASITSIYIYIYISKYCHQFMLRNLRYATSILRSKCGGSTFRSVVIASVAPRLIWSRVIKGLGQRHLN